MFITVKNDVPASFFNDSNDAGVNSAYTEIMRWVQRSPKYVDQAKAKFASAADDWLVAYSMVKGTIVVTNEMPRPESKNGLCCQISVLSSMCHV